MMTTYGMLARRTALPLLSRNNRIGLQYSAVLLRQQSTHVLNPASAQGTSTPHPLKGHLPKIMEQAQAAELHLQPPKAFGAHTEDGIAAEWTVDSVWSREELHGVKVTHRDPTDIADKIALKAVRFCRWTFDWVAGFKTGSITEDKYLNRVIFLETVAAIPGMVAGTLRHLNSLRKMKRDHGWIHTLLEEAENERMHLLTFLYMKKPGPVFRIAVTATQGLIWNLFFFTYLVNPKICHRFVGYIEEEAVHTYTSLLKDIDEGRLPMFENLGVPSIAVDYWKLPRDALFRDLILAIRCDEANHRLVNHTFADLHAEFKSEEVNPFDVQAAVAKNGGLIERPINEISLDKLSQQVHAMTPPPAAKQ
ncbi:alternative oxidase [Tribonema minus]|uniref:Alternative oxidase n=1 Tax=Tribonema minus TaxID=303371 RepID=A0A836CI40_9STRA|nr:alternative oxidase [Tribonema minus]